MDWFANATPLDTGRPNPVGVTVDDAHLTEWVHDVLADTTGPVPDRVDHWWAAAQIAGVVDLNWWSVWVEPVGSEHLRVLVHRGMLTWSSPTEPVEWFTGDRRSGPVDPVHIVRQVALRANLVIFEPARNPPVAAE